MHVNIRSSERKKRKTKGDRPSEPDSGAPVSPKSPDDDPGASPSLHARSAARSRHSGDWPGISLPSSASGSRS